MAVNNLITLRKGTAAEWTAADPVLSSGEPGFDVTNNLLKIGDGVTTWLNLSPTIASDIQVYVKNNTGAALNKGQVVYIDGALGNNPTIQLSIASGEATSSKTLGLLKQNLGINEFGYVVSEGILEGIDTDSASAAGDSMWLSPSVSGGIVYGLANKPSAPNHMVFLGYVLRKQQNNGKVYVKVQNGYELEELHNVAISGVSNGQFLQYNSASGLWLASSSGNFISLSVNGTGVSVSGHTHVSSDITDFNSAVIAASPEEIVEYATSDDFPVSGVASILYLSTDASKSYRWAGNAYVEIGPSPSFVANHTHSSADITNFNTSVSGLLPVKNIVAGSGVSIVSNESIFTVNVIEDIRWLLFLPPAPTNVAGTAGNGQVTLTWTAPTVLAQTPITDYVVQYSSNSGSTWTTFSDGTSTTASATVTGLTNGTAYTFRVAAVNAIGTGGYSTTASVTPANETSVLSVAIAGTGHSFSGAGLPSNPFVAATYEAAWGTGTKFLASANATVTLTFNATSYNYEDPFDHKVWGYNSYPTSSGPNTLLLAASSATGTNITRSFSVLANRYFVVEAQYGYLTNLRISAVPS